MWCASIVLAGFLRLNLFIEQGNLIKKMRFPRITLPAIVVSSNLFHNVLLITPMVVIFLLLENHFSLIILWLLPMTILLAAFSLGVELVLGVLSCSSALWQVSYYF